MSRKRKPEPDTRYRWDDPDLPVYASKSGRALPADKVQQVCQMNMTRNAPHYSQDPSYHWRTKRVNTYGK